MAQVHEYSGEEVDLFSEILSWVVHNLSVNVGFIKDCSSLN